MRPLTQLDFMGIVARAVRRAGLQLLDCRIRHVAQLLTRLYRRARGRQTVVLKPTVEYHAWIKEINRQHPDYAVAASALSVRTIRRHAAFLQDLGLIALERHGQHNLVVFKFRPPCPRLRKASGHQEEPGTLAASSLCGEGEAPIGLRPSAVEGPTGAALAPQSAAATPPPDADTSSAPSRAGFVCSGPPVGLREGLQRRLEASPWRRRDVRRAQEQQAALQGEFLTALLQMTPAAQRRWRQAGA